MTNLLSGEYYQAHTSLRQRFQYHVALGLKKNIGDRTDCHKNIFEKIGDLGLIFIENTPRIVSKLVHDPKIVTIALTALALIAASFLFYPVTTFLTLKTAVILIPPLWTVRLAGYIVTIELILASACRAEGRFSNTSLMKKFYGNVS
jgi:hypothetical protein